ncbi:MAG: integrase core domain-containing protein [Chromatiales bacterium]
MISAGCFSRACIERPNPVWASVKYENVYLNAYGTIREATAGLASYFKFYNQARPHQSLDGKTPDEVYFGNRTLLLAA